MSKYTKNMTMNMNNMVMNMRITFLISKEQFPKTQKMIEMVTKMLTEMSTKKMFMNAMMETMKHIILNMHITQNLLKLTAKYF